MPAKVSCPVSHLTVGSGSLPPETQGPCTGGFNGAVRIQAGPALPPLRTPKGRLSFCIKAFLTSARPPSRAVTMPP